MDNATLYRYGGVVLVIAAVLAVLRWLWVTGLRALRTFIRALWPHL